MYLLPVVVVVKILVVIVLVVFCKRSDRKSYSYDINVLMIFDCLCNVL